MRKTILLATALAFMCADFALAAPAPFSAAGQAVVAGSGSDVTLVRHVRHRRHMRHRRHIRRMHMRHMRMRMHRGAANATEPGVVATPSGQNPAVDVGVRHHGRAGH